MSDIVLARHQRYERNYSGCCNAGNQYISQDDFSAVPKPAILGKGHEIRTSASHTLFQKDADTAGRLVVASEQSKDHAYQEHQRHANRHHSPRTGDGHHPPQFVSLFHSSGPIWAESRFVISKWRLAIPFFPGLDFEQSYPAARLRFPIFTKKRFA